ncbi:MAG: alpha/beta hydrolase-fold protein [Ferruginibacter sp.]
MKPFLLIISFCFAHALYAWPGNSIDTTRPFVLGVVQTMQSSILGEERTLNIYLPTDYNVKDSILYPVVYLLDGTADEDFIHIAGLIQFMNFPWVDMLPKSILVGIANVDRRRDYTFPTSIKKDKEDFPTTGRSENFINFLEKEVQPFIANNYKTTASSTIIGQSLGGLVATEILFKRPELFTNYLIISPSLWWDNESLLRVYPKINAPIFTKATSIYIAVGKEGEKMVGDAKKLESILRNARKKNVTVNFEYFNAENHASILHNAVYKGFELMNRKSKLKKN